jgi:hypothetical protein
LWVRSPRKKAHKMEDKSEPAPPFTVMRVYGARYKVFVTLEDRAGEVATIRGDVTSPNGRELVALRVGDVLDKLPSK